MYKLCLLFFYLVSVSPVKPPCENAISLKKVEAVSGKGHISLSVSSKGAYTCTLNVERGQGITKIEAKSGNGNSSIDFDGLDVAKIYQVEVEFLTEDKSSFCRKLQKSQIIFDAK